MTGTLIVEEAGPGVTVQDRGRPGFLEQGLSRGGAADVHALDEADALLGGAGAVLECAGFGGVFCVDRPARVALTGAPMAVERDGEKLTWNAVHLLEPGQRLRIGGAQSGVYGYLAIGGGIESPSQLGSRATHRIAGLGTPVEAGQKLTLGQDSGNAVGVGLPMADRFGGGALRVVASAQTARFSKDVRDAFLQAEFLRSAKGNRQGIALDAEGQSFAAEGGLTVLSELIVPGDIQMTGDGLPYVLLAECQTTGGYPRIATVIPPDLPKAAQTAPGQRLRFAMISLEEAVDAIRREAAWRKSLASQVTPLIRDLASVNLLEYNLISGVT